MLLQLEIIKIRRDFFLLAINRACGVERFKFCKADFMGYKNDLSDGLRVDICVENPITLVLISGLMPDLYECFESIKASYCKII